MTIPRIPSLFDIFRGYEPIELVVELLIIWLVVWMILRFLRRSSGAGVIRGFAVLLVVVAILLRLTGDANDTLGRIRFLGDRVVGLVAIMLVVVFQPELRQAMVTLGRAKIFGRSPAGQDRVITAVSEAVDFLAKSEFGAIIVFERSLGLESLLRNSVPIDATVDPRLLQAIFYPNNPLHDLAVVIRADRIVAAKVQLPLAPSGVVPSQLGSRHRAAVGVTLDSDCLVVVVSEENGRVRIAENGKLSPPIARNRFADELARRLSVVKDPVPVNATEEAN
jgi:diadenylate cyclase